MLLVWEGDVAVLAEEEDWWEVSLLAGWTDGGFGFAMELVLWKTKGVLIKVS